MHWWVSQAFPVILLAEGPYQLSIEDIKGFGRREGLLVLIWVCFQVPVSRHNQLLARSRHILKLTGLMEHAFLLKGTTLA